MFPFSTLVLYGYYILQKRKVVYVAGFIVSLSWSFLFAGLFSLLSIDLLSSRLVVFLLMMGLYSFSLWLLRI
jgi:hypothetical protein